MGIVQEFRDFLNEYKVVGLAVAFIMGAATTALVQALVNDIVMPVVGAAIPGGEWQEATLTLGPVLIKWGHFTSALLNFIIIALVVFMIAKVVLKEEKVAKR